MADDRMKNEEQQRNLGGANREDQDYSQKSPGRGQDESKQAGGQQGGQQGGQRENRNMEDDEDVDTGRGGQNRGGQNR